MPLLIWSNTLLRLTVLATAASSPISWWRFSICDVAAFSLPTTFITSPTWGTLLKPRTSTGVEGVARFTRFPASLNMALTLPQLSPTTMISPSFKVPELTRTVKRAPLVLSISASITVPSAGLFGSAFSSSNSATIIRFSNKSEIPFFSLAETDTLTVSPPQSSTTRPTSASCCLTRSGLAPGLSILLIATTIGTPAARAWSIASKVCGMTPSSAATTSTVISVTCAPRARIAVKASCPGVSRKVIFCPLKST